MKRNRSLSELIRETEQSLQELDDAKEFVLQKEKELEEAKQQVQDWFEKLKKVRDVLVRDYPEIMGVDSNSPNAASTSPSLPEEGLEVVHVDDENDPRYTSEEVTGDIEFQER